MPRPPRPRLFCPECGRLVAQQNPRYGTIETHRGTLDKGARGLAPICTGSSLKGLRQPPAQPGGAHA